MGELRPESGPERIQDQQVVTFLQEYIDAHREAFAGQGEAFEITILNLNEIKENPLMQQWMSELQAEVDSVYETQAENPEAIVQAQLSMDIRRATAYYQAGLSAVAIETLQGSLDAAESVVMSDSGVAQHVSTLLAKMRAGETLG